MGTEEPVGDVERPKTETADETTANNPAKEKAKAAQDTPFKRFISGPYFDIIPAQYEFRGRANSVAKGTSTDADAANAAKDDEHVGDDYLGKLKKIVTSKVDVDGDYGLAADELVPLPFDVPKWHAYLVEILIGVYMVAQATIVMFITIYVENQERAWKDGTSYTKSWLPIIKALIIVYPLCTLLILVGLTIEYSIRKFMYFRLLSMRILVDWHNVPPHKTIFLYYFLATWALMNAWAIYGVAKYYNKNGNQGVDPVSFGCFVVVNLQTIQLLLYYIKLLSSETRLVSLNQIFERAPVEAQHLLEFTYVIEEQDLIDECYAFALYSQRTLLRRIFNIVTCCIAAKDWNAAERQICFDIERLKRRAANRSRVEQNVKELLEDMGVKPEDAGSSNGNDAERDPDAVQVQVDEMSRDPAAPNAVAPELTPDGRPLPREFPREYLSCCGLRPLQWAYQNAYGSIHSLHTSVLISFDTWPFRPDVPYFRMLTFVQLGSVIAVGAIVVLGWLFSTRDSSCTKSAKTCNTCYTVHERYFASDEPVCLAMETAIANIVASANGTWNNNGVVEERYCNWQCYGSFTANQTCPPVV